MATEAPRSSTRVLNYGKGPPDDGAERERDICPNCGGERWQLIIVPDRFYCDDCEVATFGPNTEVAEAEPEQIDLFASTTDTPTPIQAGSPIAKRARDVLESAVSDYVDERPPVDEGDAWMAEEMPDE